MQSKLEIHFHEHVLIMIVIIKKLLELFMKMNCKKQTNKNLGIKKLLKKRKKLCVKWKGYYSSFITGLIKMMLNEIPLYKNESIRS